MMLNLFVQKSKNFIVMAKLVLIGGGGHCQSCIEVIEASAKHVIHGILDLPVLKGNAVSGYPIIGSDEMIPELAAQGFRFLITIGHLNNNDARKSLFLKLHPYLDQLETIVAPSSIVSRFSSIGYGTVVMHQAVINSGSSIGDNCIINTGALVEHNSKVGNHVHLSTHAVINGDCTIGNDVFIGSGAVLINGIHIIDNTFIAAGAVIHKSIDEAGLYGGNPYHRIK